MEEYERKWEGFEGGGQARERVHVSECLVQKCLNSRAWCENQCADDMTPRVAQ